MIKSLKLPAVVLAHAIYKRNMPSTRDLLCSFLLASGAFLFSLGHSSEDQTDIRGVAIVLGSLVFDAVHAVLQEDLLRKIGASEAESVFYTYSYGSVFALIGVVVNREVTRASRVFYQQPGMIFALTLRSASMFLGIWSFTTIVKRFGIINATVVATSRKVCTILASFLLFPKLLSSIHLIAILCFVTGIYVKTSESRHSMTKEESDGV
jgi:drug/metabolite transporter (DMT)-like permease